MNASSGQVLIEIIVAFLILILVGIGLAETVGVSSQGVSSSKAKVAGVYLGEEEAEALRAVALEDWYNISNLATSSGNLYHTATSSTSSAKWVTASNSETVTLNSIQYTRSFYLDDVYRSTSTGNIISSGGYYDPSTIKVTVKVQWPVAGGTQLFTKAEYLSRYLNDIYTQTDWSGGAVGEASTSAATTSFATSSGIDAGTAGSIQLLVQ